MLELKHNNGNVQIADEVIATIAGTAAMEVDGLAGMVGNITGDLAGILGRKHMARGVKIEVTGEQAVITLSVVIKYGFKIQEVCAQVQERVRVAVETMTGLSASEINVHVSGVQMDKSQPEL